MARPTFNTTVMFTNHQNGGGAPATIPNTISLGNEAASLGNAVDTILNKALQDGPESDSENFENLNTLFKNQRLDTKRGFKF